jgi:hypothetical protein
MFNFEHRQEFSICLTFKQALENVPSYLTGTKLKVGGGQFSRRHSGRSLPVTRTAQMQRMLQALPSRTSSWRDALKQKQLCFFYCKKFKWAIEYKDFTVVILTV